MLNLDPDPVGIVEDPKVKELNIKVVSRGKWQWQDPQNVRSVSRTDLGVESEPKVSLSASVEAQVSLPEGMAV